MHHGRNAGYLDRNYGGMIVIFDRWFGTYVAETVPVEYGIVPPRHLGGAVAGGMRNPLAVNLHEFVAMWRDVARPGRWADRLGHLWRPPGWTRPER